MNYSEAIAEISRLERFGIKLGLERIRALLADSDHPEKKLKIIQVAGTNGKGSVAAMLAFILEAARFRVGLYTSPHLNDWRERLAILEGQGLSYISKREFSKGIERLKPSIACLKKEKNSPTIFEVLTALALDYFAKKKLDFVVLEAGLGGRLDATNISQPLVSIITNIALEHTEYLGETKEQIAKEKAGIIKEKGIVVTAEEEPAILRFIEKKARLKKARLIRIGKEIKLLSSRIKKTKTGFYHQVTIKGLRGFYSNLELALWGRHQAINAATALGAIESLGFSGIEISSPAIRKGLKSVYWPGRLEVISRKPLVLLDGAHNPAASRVIAETLKELKCFRKLFLIFGCLKDKDMERMLEAFLPLSFEVIATQPQNIRALDPNIVSQKMSRENRRWVVRKRPNEALKYALSQAKNNDLVLITGSLYLIGEIKRALKKCSCANLR